MQYYQRPLVSFTKTLSRGHSQAPAQPSVDNPIIGLTLDQYEALYDFEGYPEGYVPYYMRQRQLPPEPDIHPSLHGSCRVLVQNGKPVNITVSMPAAA